jgi:hypothetical protein
MKENTVSNGYHFLPKCFQVWCIYGSNVYEMNHTLGKQKEKKMELEIMAVVAVLSHNISLPG